MGVKRALVCGLATVGSVALSFGAIGWVDEPGAATSEQTPATDLVVQTLDVPPVSAPSGRTRIDAVRNELKVLQRPPERVDLPPAHIVESPLLEDEPARAEDARRVRAVEQAWIAPSTNREAVCVLGPGELACPSAEVIERDGAAVGFFKHHGTPWRVTGVATDEVTAVTVLRDDGSVSQVPVKHNYFEMESSAPPIELSWEGPNGRVVIPGPVVR